MALKFAFTYFRKEHIKTERLSADFDAEAFCNCLRGPILTYPYTQDSFQVQTPQHCTVSRYGRSPWCVIRHCNLWIVLCTRYS